MIKENEVAYWWIQGLAESGGTYVEVPDYPHMFKSFAEAETAAREVIGRYRAVRIVKEELILVRVVEGVAV